jgi:prephenate dehydrogenase
LAKKPLFERVAIVGVGLIGGSVGMAVKRRGLARWVTGVARRKETVARIFAHRAADLVTLDLAEGVKGADLVILCAPVFTIVKNLRDIAPHLKRGAVVIDVGSSKTPIVAEAGKRLKKNVFVGCHPMAGSEKCGIENASADLFEKSVCFMTSRHAGVARFWSALGAKPVVVNAAEHDGWVAKASHLPHVSAFAHLSALERLPASITENLSGYLNPSIRPTTRLAKSNPEMWSQILLSNRGPVLAALDDYAAGLSKIRKALAKSDAPALKRVIAHANLNAKRLMPDEK